MKHKNKPHHTLLVETGNATVAHWFGTLRSSGIRALGPAQLCVLRNFKPLTGAMMNVSLSPQELKKSLEDELSSVREQLKVKDHSLYGRRLSPDEFLQRHRHLKGLQKQLTSLSVQDALERLEVLDSKQLGRQGHTKGLNWLEKAALYAAEFERLELTERREELKAALSRLSENQSLHLPDLAKKFNKSHWKNPISLIVQAHADGLSNGSYIYCCGMPPEANIGKKPFQEALSGASLQFIEEEKHKGLPLKGIPALILYASEYQMRALAPRLIEAVYRFFRIQNPKSLED